MSDLEDTLPEPSNYGGDAGGNYRSLDPAPPPDTEHFGSDRAGVEQAAEERSRTLAERNDVEPIKFYDVETGKVAGGDRDVSAEYAADQLKSYREQKAAAAEAQLDAEMRVALDQLDGKDPAQQPEQQPPTGPEPISEPEFQPQPEAAPPEPNELDRLLEALPNEQRAPFIHAYAQQIQQAQEAVAAQYNQHIAQAQAAEQQHRQGLADNASAALASMLVSFPELEGIAPNQLGGALQLMQKQNPDRYASLQMHMARTTGVLQQAQQVAAQQQAQQQQQQQRQFQEFVQYHDNRVPVVPNLPEVQQEIISMAESHGISRQELAQLYQTNPVIRHSAFQNMMLDAARYRLAQKATRAAQVRTAPAVQRPGTRSEEAVQQSAYSVLERQMRTRDGISAKDAAKLLIARRARG